MKIKSTQSVIASFLLILAAISLFLGMDFRILLGESFVKFAMNGILVLSLIPMLNAGVGINFGLPVGVSAGLVGMCISLNLNLTGISGFLAAILFSIPVSIIFGSLYGLILNKVKGREDIAATFIGFSFIPLMNFFWTLAPFSNRKMLYPIGGSGLRPRIGLEPYFSQILDNFLLADVASIEIPFGLLIFYFSIAFLIHMFFKSRSGRRMCAVGENPEFSYFSGTNIDRERVRAVVLSTAIAGVGIVVYAQSYGFIELYNAPLMMAFPAVSALLIGGASKSHTTVFQAIMGTYLFQTIYLLSVPVANELLLPEVSEIIRMIISNGIILYAILKKEGEKLEAKN